MRDVVPQSGKPLASARTLNPQITGDVGVPDVAIVIPARNEAARILRCLEAIAAQRECAHVAIAVILVVNNTDDQTIWIAHGGTPASLSLCTIAYNDPRGGNVGLARRVGFEHVLDTAPTCKFLLTTDADCEVADDWVSIALSGLAHFDAICGRVQLIETEAQALPTTFFDRGRIEHEYLQASLELCHLLAPDPVNPYPHHGQCAGANLAFRAGVYDAVGGFLPLALGEDRDIIRRLKLDGYRVRHSEEAVVHASCRMSGRAAGGMADAIRKRVGSANPSLDSALFAYDNTVGHYCGAARPGPVWPPAAYNGTSLDADTARRDLPRLQELLRRLRVEGSVQARQTTLRTLAGVAA